MNDKNLLGKEYLLSEEDRLCLEEYMEHMSELSVNEEADYGKLFAGAIHCDEESQVELVELYMKKVPNLALEKVNRGVSLRQLLEYGMIGAVLGVNRISDANLAHESIMQEMERYMERCF